MIRILIVDDQRIVREGIKILLEKKSDIQIVGEASGANEAIKKVESLQPNIVLLDINMPEIDGFSVLNKISLVSPHVKIIMLSSHEDKEYVQKATKLGAKGYLLKNASSQQLEWSIKLVHQGYSTIKSELLEEQFARSTVSESDINLDSKSHANSHTETLTAEGGKPTNNLQPASSSVVTVSRKDQAKSNKLQFRLPKKTPTNRYPNYPKLKVKSNSRFHSVKVLKIKKTITSVEFKLLVLAILFCLGFLIFIALS